MRYTYSSNVTLQNNFFLFFCKIMTKYISHRYISHSFFDSSFIFCFSIIRKKSQYVMQKFFNKRESFNIFKIYLVHTYIKSHIYIFNIYFYNINKIFLSFTRLYLFKIEQLINLLYFIIQKNLFLFSCICEETFFNNMY